MIEIDGSYGEGGGQILRTALSLSIYTGQPFKISKIRKGRCKSGLSTQHLKCVESAAKFCGGEFSEAKIGSEEVEFTPGKKLLKKLEIDIGTAGSITLLLQSLLLPSIMSDKKIIFNVIGGTDVNWSMPIDYFTNVLVKNMVNLVKIDVKLMRRGYYPKGQGIIEITIKKKEENIKFDFTKIGKIRMIKGISHASIDLQSFNVAERQKNSAKHFLESHNYKTDISCEYSNSLSSGSGITLFGSFSTAEDFGYKLPLIKGSDSLGKKGKSSELVGEEAAKKLLHEIKTGSVIDEFFADNIIPYLAIFGGEMVISEFTGHVKSNIYVTEKFLGSCFEINENLIKSKGSNF